MNGKHLAEIRKQLGFTQDDMAQLLAVAGGLIISQWENSYRNPSKITKKLYGLFETLPEHEVKKLILWLRNNENLGVKKKKK